jgi:probable HAF family extracellular repeat protein
MSAAQAEEGFSPRVGRGLRGVQNMNQRKMCLVALSLVAGSAFANPYTIEVVGGFSTPGFPEIAAAYAQGLNASGQVVGQSIAFDADGEFSQGRAFLWQGGSSNNLGAITPEDDSNALDINDSGQIVGWSGSEAALFSGGTITSLGKLSGGTGSGAYAINNSGLIVGSADDANGNNFAVTFSGGSASIIPISGAQYSFAQSVSNGGHIAGEWSGSATGANMRAFVSLNGVVTTFGVLPGGNRSTATDVNDSGIIAGYGTATGGERGFFSSGTDLVSIGVISGFTSSRAFGINNAGVVVGSVSAPGQQRAAIFTNGQLQLLSNLLSPGQGDWTLLYASAINDAGQIAGVGRLNGELVGFRMTPVPEPFTMTVLAAGLAGLAARRRRAR